MFKILARVYNTVFGSIFDKEIELIYENLGDFAIVPNDVLKYLIKFLDGKSLINMANTNREFRDLYSNKRAKYFTNAYVTKYICNSSVEMRVQMCKHRFINLRFIRRLENKFNVTKNFTNTGYDLSVTFNDSRYRILAKYEKKSNHTWIRLYSAVDSRTSNQLHLMSTNITNRLSKIKQKLWHIIGEAEIDGLARITYTYNYAIPTDEFVLYLEKLLEI